MKINIAGRTRRLRMPWPWLSALLLGVLMLLSGGNQVPSPTASAQQQQVELLCGRVLITNYLDECSGQMVYDQGVVGVCRAQPYIFLLIDRYSLPHQAI